MSKKNCTYTFTNGQGQKQTIMGLSSMKAFLVDGGLDLFYPSGRFPWLATESAIDLIPSSQPQAITMDQAGSMRAGDVVVDGQGNEFMALHARHKWIEVAPIVDGKPQVSADTTIKFHLEPETQHLYRQERRGDPIYATGRNLYSQEVTPAGASQTSDQMASLIAIAADSIESLRRSDVDRVITEAPAELKRQLAEHIKAKRPDLASEVDDVMAEVADTSPQGSKLTQAEAAQLMEWQNLGQKDGVKTHILTFYESRADKDAKRGRMTMATVSMGERSSGKWTVDGDDQTFTYLAAAKRRGIEVGMAQAMRQGFVEGKIQSPAPKGDDLDAMFDDVLAEEIAKDEAAKPAPQSKPKASKPRSTASKPRSTAAKPPRTAGQAAASAVKNTASALANAIDGLGALFGGGGKFNSGLSFDEDTYAKAKPLFQAAIANLGEAGQDLREAMRAVVRMVLDKFGAQAAQNMKPYVVRFINDVQNQDAPAAQENQDVPSADEGVERDSQEPAAEPALGDAVQADTGGAAGNAGGNGGQAAGGRRRGQPGRAGVSSGGAAADGERGDLVLSDGDAAVDDAILSAGADFIERGGDDGLDGVSLDPIPAEQVVAAAEAGNDKLVKLERQRAAEKVAVVPGDLDNIKATLPYLLEGQQEDVKKTEDRFAQPDGYGMLFTNGTGTGKTFTGLGVIKRFQRQGKTNVLIVVPDDKIAADWIESGELLGLSITKLKDTKDAGQGIIVATYANLGENDALARRQWDMVVADEAHTLMQSADGKVTTYLANLRAITHHPDGVSQRHSMLNRADIEALKAINDQIDANSAILNNQDTMDVQVGALLAENDRLERERSALRKKLDAARQSIQAEVDGLQNAQRARLLALSATPFAYEATIDWANGYLFDYNEGQASDKNEFRGYNQGSNRDRFFMAHFGYQMRYNKLNKPDPTKVDTGLMQREFNGWLRKKGSLSARMLDVAADYDRRFILIDSAIGNQIDEALGWLSEKAHEAKEHNGFLALRASIDERFDYLSRRYLLEAIKADASVPIVRQHMALGRKVIVFHDYKKGGGFNPFNIQASETPPDVVSSEEALAFKSAVAEFRDKFKDLVNAPLGQMDSPIEVFRREFPDVLIINGDEKPKDLLERYKKFQSDDTGPVVMLVQSDKNKGWSGHDTTGKYQRVLMNLGQPTAPTRAIQQEGRAYRTGQVTNVPMRYLNTGTSWEKWAFAVKIAERAGTAENLGMGEQARALKDSFIAAFEESDAYPPGHEGEGTGGKERDKLMNAVASVYDRAKSYYWSTQKKNSKTKAQEGKDYFATPEPVGFKMVEWLGLRGGEASLEPSAGHGAIARWLPEITSRTVIEPSMSLRARLAMVMNAGKDRIIDGTFENHAIVNKYDGIALNPPFGVGGKTAIEHLDKAAKHLRDGGRIVALIPTGPAADKRFDQWMYGESVRPTKPLFVHESLGEIHKGDTVTFNVFGRPLDVVVDRVDRAATGHFARAAGQSMLQAQPLVFARKVSPGKRTESYRAADNLYMVADIKLPQVTFERAGTAVATHIVVLEKHTDPERFNLSARNIDLSGITDINVLFDRLEDMSLPPRAMTAEQEAAAPKAAPNEAPAKKQPKSANPDAVGTVDRQGLPIIEHVTKKGKTLRGIVKTDWLQEEALKIDPFTFRKDGGWFIREEYLKPEGGDDTAETPAFSRSQERPSGMSVAETESIVNSIKSGWRNAPEIIVVADMHDPKVPQKVREYDAEQQSLGAQGEPEGFWADNKVYLVADAMHSQKDVIRVLFHEALGHYGLRGLFGDRLDTILRQVVSMRRLDVEDKADEYGYDMLDEDQALMAAEEVLAVMAQENPKLGFVKRAIGAIRSWLRRTMPGLFGQMELTDAEIIQQFILPARAFVERGAIGAAAGGAAFSRSQDQTKTEAFKRWFGDSKVVGADGRPLRVYHGSPSADITAFDARKEGANTGAADVDHGLGGFYFTTDPNISDTYARTHEVEFANIAEQELGLLPSGALPNSTIYPAFLSIKNPLMVKGGAITQAVIDRARNGGHDGIIKGGSYPEYVAFRPEQIKSAIGNNGDFDPANPDIRFSRATPAPAAQPSAWEAPADTIFDRRVVYALQDKHVDTKRVQAAITKTAGEIEDEVNAYQREELYHGRAAKRAQDFLTRELNPMVEQLAKDKIELADFEEFLHARHAPEANRVLAERNPNQAMIDAGLEAATLEIEAVELELANTTDPTEIKVLSRRMREAQADLSKWSSVQAFRGPEEDRLRLSGMSDDQARAIMGALTPEQRQKLDDAAAQFDAIVAQNRQLMVDYDLEDQETVDSWGQLFQHYVPLMREDEGNGIQQGMGTGQGFSIKGREVKSRTGSTRKVVDIVANVAMQRERIITRGEKNRVSQALMGLAALNPNPDFWRLGAPDKKRQYDPATNTVKVVTDPQYKNRENVVVAKVRNSKGRVTEVALTFNERDERAVRMAAAIKNLEDGQLNWALGNMAKITRYLASINTQYNPIFGIVNVIRDMQGAAVNLAGTPLKDSKTRIIRNAIVAIGSIYRGARQERKGRENESDWGKLWREFQEVGGMTGFRDQFRDSKDRARAIERTMNPEKWMESAFGKVVTAGGLLKTPMTWAQEGAGWVAGWLSDYNLAMENGVRLATYKSGLDNGLTKEQAASLAKNITVNFNRRGTHGMQIGAAYAFFNAAMQGTARMGQAFTTMEDGKIKTLRLSPLGKKVLAGGMMMGVAQAVVLAAAGFGDDEPPDFVREKNMIIPTGWTGTGSDKGYVTIPMPLGLHVIPGLGRHMTEFMMSGGKDPAGRSIAIFGMLLDAFNPIGNAGWSLQTFVPTVVDPMAALAENKDFTGRNIALESRDKNVPGHKLAKDTASTLSKFLSEAINTLTGGNDYVSGHLSPTPDQIDYLFGQITGGVGREALKAEQVVSSTITGEELPLYKIPLVGRFVGDSSGSAGQSNIFRANIDRLDRAEKEIEGLRKDGRLKESEALRQKSDPYLLAQARVAESQVRRLRSMKRDMVDKGASRESVREVERKISEAMGRLNKAVESRAR